MKLHQDHKKLIVVMLFGLLSAGILTTGSFVQQQRNTSNTQASSLCNCTDSNVCYPDGCSRKPKTADNRYEESRYDSVCRQFDPGYRMSDELIRNYCSVQQPDCCFDIYRYKESRLCCWQERYACHPSLCEGSSGGEGCGWYWDLYKGGAYGCVVPGANGEVVPAWGLPPNLPRGSQPTNTPQPIISTNTPVPQQPTNTPIPTVTPHPGEPTKPFVPPTTIPTQQPHSTVSPTNPPPYVPIATSIPESEIPTSAPQSPRPTIEIKSPKEIAREVINPENIQKLSEKTEMPLEAPKKGIAIMKNVDSIVEQTAETWIFKIRIFIESLFR